MTDFYISDPIDIGCVRYILSAKLKPLEKLVLFHIVCEPDHGCARSRAAVDSIAGSIGVSTDQVSRIVRILVKLGILTIESYNDRIINIWFGRVLGGASKDYEIARRKARAAEKDRLKARSEARAAKRAARRAEMVAS